MLHTNNREIIKSIEDIILLLTNGVINFINSHAYKDIKFISNATSKFGSSTISFDVQVIKVDGKFMTFYNNGRTPSGYDLIEWLNIVQNEGVKIIHICWKRGSDKGFDNSLLDECRKYINVPVLVNGGLSCPKEISSLKKNYNINGVLLGSIIHYEFFSNKNVSSEMINKKIINKIDYSETYKISEIKKFLKEEKIEVMIQWNQ